MVLAPSLLLHPRKCISHTPYKLFIKYIIHIPYSQYVIYIMHLLRSIYCIS